MQHKVNQFLGEKSGQSLRAEIYSNSEGYTISYFINDVEQNNENFPGKSIHFVENAALNWISGIEILNG